MRTSSLSSHSSSLVPNQDKARDDVSIHPDDEETKGDDASSARPVVKRTTSYRLGLTIESWWYFHNHVDNDTAVAF